MLSRWNILVNESLVANKETQIDLIQLAAAQAKPLILLTDLDSFTHFISNRFITRTTDESFLLDEAPLAVYEFSEYSKLRAIIFSLLFLLRQKNIEFEFINGTSEALGDECQKKYHFCYLKDVYRRIKHLELVLTSDKILEICSCFGVPIQDIPVPPLFKTQVQSALKEMGYRLWSSLNSTELMMTTIVKRRNQYLENSELGKNILRNIPPIFAVFSDAPEFCLLGHHLRWLPTKLFDPFNRLPQLVELIIAESSFFITKNSLPVNTDKIHYLVTLEAHIIRPCNLKSLASLNREQIIETVIFTGNRFTTPFYENFRDHFINWPIPRSLNEIYEIAVTSYESPNASVEATRTIFHDAQRCFPDFRKAVVLSQKFYHAEDTEDTFRVYSSNCFSTIYPFWRLGRNVFSFVLRFFNESSNHVSPVDRKLNNLSTNALTRALEVLIHTASLPIWLYQAYRNHVYYRPPHLEYTTLQDFVIEDILLDLRRCSYGILCGPAHKITEYGRSQLNFASQVEVHPVELPANLTFQGILSDCFHSHISYDRLTSFQEFVGYFGSTMGHTAPQRLNSNSTFLQMFIYVLCALSTSNYLDVSLRSSCFVTHELESLVASIIATSGRYTQWNDPILPELAQASHEVRRIYSDFSIQGLDLRLEDPLNLCYPCPPRRYQSKNRFVLYGLVPGYRATVVFGLFQHVWKYMVEIASLYNSVTQRTTEPLYISPSLIFDGKIFRWIYAAGALKWFSNDFVGTCQIPRWEDALPTEIHPSVHNQMKTVSRIRSLLLRTHLVHSIP